MQKCRVLFITKGGEKMKIDLEKLGIKSTPYYTFENEEEKFEFCDTDDAKRLEQQRNDSILSKIDQNLRIEKFVDNVSTTKEALLSDIYFENCDYIESITGLSWNEIKERLKGVEG